MMYFWVKFSALLAAIRTKITLFLFAAAILASCNAVKRVPKDRQLLVENEIRVDGKKEKEDVLENLLYQRPNAALLGYKLRLNLYNLAKPNPDSSYKAKFRNDPKKLERQSRLLSAKQVERKGQSFFYSGIHNFLKKTGEPPVILDTLRTRKSLSRLESYFFNTGYFKAKGNYRVDSAGKQRAKVRYDIAKGDLYRVDTISKDIATPVLDSLYEASKNQSLIKTGDPYRTENFDAERNRITADFRNKGAYYFQQSNILFTIDTVANGTRANVDMEISDQSIRMGDSTVTRPFKLYKISRVDIFTDHPADPDNVVVRDSTFYNGFNLYSYDRLRYKPRAITDAVFVAPGTYYSDFRTNITTRSLSNLKVFNYPTIQYRVDPDNEDALIARVILTPRKKYSFGASLDFTHSNIQDFGIEATTSFAFRNVFRRAETLEIAARGNIGSSRAFAEPNDPFFNLLEYGIDTRLSFPRMLLPFNTEKLIPKRMIPTTVLSMGFAKQKNIGLDKENFTGSFTYNWIPKRNQTMRFDLINIQYINNLRTDRYFNVYRSSYARLNELAEQYNVNPAYVESADPFRLKIEEGTNGFIRDVLSESTSLQRGDPDYQRVARIEQRRQRLTENNLIVASSFSFSKTTKQSLTDNTFYVFRTKLESAGNLLSLFTRASEVAGAQDSKKRILDIEYSQYFKTEFEYIKHWDLSRERVFAVRGFAGIAVPYGNSDNVPFSRSYFAGGSNDIRAWQPYSLGPGRSGSSLDFNEANLKLTLNAEYRFKVLNSLKGALFVDAGNIWNVFDNINLEGGDFTGIESLEDIAVGSGFGFRYDLSFFVIRIDMGFKTYDPADPPGSKWFRKYNFANSVLNIGINYPF